MLADFSKINPKHYMNPNDSAGKDYQFCRWLPKEIGVTAIPPTAFFTPQVISLYVEEIHSISSMETWFPTVQDSVSLRKIRLWKKLAKDCKG